MAWSDESLEEPNGEHDGHPVAHTAPNHITQCPIVSGAAPTGSCAGASVALFNRRYRAANQHSGVAHTDRHHAGELPGAVPTRVRGSVFAARP